MVFIEIYGGPPVVQRKLITNCGGTGIRVDNFGTIPLIENNTLRNNRSGFSLLDWPSPIIKFNNIENNTNNVKSDIDSFQKGSSADVDAAYNWWGTTDQQAISQTIYDFKNDFNLGTVEFVPFLTAPNPEAPSYNPDFTVMPTTTPTPSPSPSPSQAPSENTPILDIFCISATSYSNFKVNITGSLTNNGTGILDAKILLSYSVNAGNSWIDLTTSSTDGNGDFSEVWTPQVTGNYMLKAVYTDSSNYSDVSKIVNFAVMPFQEQNVFSVMSNSTVTSLFFNSTSQELSFSVNGTSGTTGYVSIYLPKTLVSDVSALKVYLDGTPLTYTTTQQDDSVLVSFTYHHSIHQVTISLSASAASDNQFNEWIIIGIVVAIVIIVAAVFAVVRTKKKATKT